MIGITRAASTGRGMGIAAISVGALTLVALFVTFVWGAVLMAGGAGGFAVMSVMPIMGPVVLALGAIGIVLSLVAISRKSVRRLGVTGLLMSATPLLAWLILLLITLVAG